MYDAYFLLPPNSMSIIKMLSFISMTVFIPATIGFSSLLITMPMVCSAAFTYIVMRIELSIDFPDLEAFGHNNFIIELSDLETIIEWVTTNSDFEEEADFENMTLIGHSRGGGIVTIKASENNKITKVITWSGVSDFGARFPHLKGGGKNE